MLLERAGRPVTTKLAVQRPRILLLDFGEPGAAVVWEATSSLRVWVRPLRVLGVAVTRDVRMSRNGVSIDTW